MGARFSNVEDLHKLNTDLAVKNVYLELHRGFGYKGTILQKVYFCNIIIFSKLWYLAQNFRMDEKILDKVLAKVMAFIYSGENERPVRPLNFRDVRKVKLYLFEVQSKEIKKSGEMLGTQIQGVVWQH